MAEAEAEVKQDSAASGTTQADTGAAARGSQAQTTTQAESVTDVGQGEAYLLNMKRLVASELNYDAFLNGQAQRIVAGAITFDGQLQTLALQSLQNAITLQNRVNNNAIDSDGRKTGNDEQYDKAADQVSINNLVHMEEEKKKS